MATPPEPDPRLDPPVDPTRSAGWSDDDWAYAVEGRSTPSPPPPRRRLLTSRRLTAILALVAAVLLGIAILPSLGLTLPRIIIEFGGGASPTPVPTAMVTANPSPTGEPTFVRPTPTAVPTFMSYVVRPGDSLGTIATVYRTTARSIAWWNRGTYPSLDPESPAYNPGVIQPGWTLVLIPGVVVDDANPPSASPPRATPPATAGPSGSAAPTTGASATPRTASPAASPSK